MLTKKENERARVLLADDHVGVLEDLRTLLESEFDVVAAVGDGNALITAVDALRPDVIITDISMPGLDGISAAGKILRQSPSSRVVFITVHDNLEIAQRSFSLGALGYVVKGGAGDELIPAINAALQGRQYVSATLRSKLPMKLNE
jgi:DNA-binding NarL/FixJ family response regulator